MDHIVSEEDDWISGFMNQFQEISSMNERTIKPLETSQIYENTLASYPVLSMVFYKDSLDPISTDVDQFISKVSHEYVENDNSEEYISIVDEEKSKKSANTVPKHLNNRHTDKNISEPQRCAIIGNSSNSPIFMDDDFDLLEQIEVSECMGSRNTEINPIKQVLIHREAQLDLASINGQLKYIQNLKDIPMLLLEMKMSSSFQRKKIQIQYYSALATVDPVSVSLLCESYEKIPESHLFDMDEFNPIWQDMECTLKDNQTNPNQILISNESFEALDKLLASETSFSNEEFSMIFEEPSTEQPHIFRIEESTNDALQDFMRTRGIEKSEDKLFIKKPHAFDERNDVVTAKSMEKSSLFICHSVTHIYRLWDQMIAVYISEAKSANLVLYCPDNYVNDVFNSLIRTFQLEPKQKIIHRFDLSHAIPTSSKIIVASPETETLVEQLKKSRRKVILFIWCPESSPLIESSFLLQCNTFITSLKSHKFVFNVYAVHRPIIKTLSDMKLYMDYFNLHQVICVPPEYTNDLVPKRIHLVVPQQLEALLSSTYAFISQIKNTNPELKKLSDVHSLKNFISTMISELKLVSDKSEKARLSKKLKNHLSLHVLLRTYENLIEEGVYSANAYIQGALRQYGKLVNLVYNQLGPIYKYSISEIQAGLFDLHPKYSAVTSIITEEIQRSSRPCTKALILVEYGGNAICEELTQKLSRIKILTLPSKPDEKNIMQVLQDSDVVITPYEWVALNLQRKDLVTTTFIRSFSVIIEWRNITLSLDNLPEYVKYYKFIVRDPFGNDSNDITHENSFDMIGAFQQQFAFGKDSREHIIVDVGAISDQCSKYGSAILEVKPFAIVKQEDKIHVLCNETCKLNSAHISSLNSFNICSVVAPLDLEYIVLNPYTCILFEDAITEEKLSVMIFNLSLLCQKYQHILILFDTTPLDMIAHVHLFTRFKAKISHFDMKGCLVSIRFLTDHRQFGEYIFDFMNYVAKEIGTSLEEWSSAINPLILKAGHPSLPSYLLSLLPYSDLLRSEAILSNVKSFGHLLQFKDVDLLSVLQQSMSIDNAKVLLECLTYSNIDAKNLRDYQPSERGKRKLNTNHSSPDVVKKTRT